MLKINNMSEGLVVNFNANLTFFFIEDIHTNVVQVRETAKNLKIHKKILIIYNVTLTAN